MNVSPTEQTQASQRGYDLPAFMQFPAPGQGSEVLYDRRSETQASTSQSMTTRAPNTAISPDQYTIAIICALKREFEPVLDLFDGTSFCTYHGPPQDSNIYVVGQFAGHHTVLIRPGDIGELDAGMCTQRLRDHFTKIELTLLVGICGAMPRTRDDEPIYLGDVIVGTKVWRYLHNARGNQLPSGGVSLDLRNLLAHGASQRVKQLGNLLETRPFRKQTINDCLSYLRHLQGGEQGAKFIYPGYEMDKFFKSNCTHRHRSSGLSCECADQDRSSCEDAKRTPCEDLGCENDGIERVRAYIEELPRPNIHIGTIASADVVMRASPEFGTRFEENNVLGIDMEGGGVRQATDCIVIKGAVDYADTHKNKVFADYAAGAAASAAKAFLMNLYRGTTSM